MKFIIPVSVDTHDSRDYMCGSCTAIDCLMGRAKCTLYETGLDEDVDGDFLRCEGCMNDAIEIHSKIEDEEDLTEYRKDLKEQGYTALCNTERCSCKIENTCHTGKENSKNCLPGYMHTCKICECVFLSTSILNLCGDCSRKLILQQDDIW